MTAPDYLDPRDVASSTGGVFGTGDSVKDTDCMTLWAAEADRLYTTGLATSARLPGLPIRLEQGVVRRRPWEVWAAGRYGARLIPTPAMAGQWVWTDEDLCRRGTRTDRDTTVNWAKHKAGAAGGRFGIFGDRSFVVHGYRTTGSMDDAEMDVGVFDLAGMGIKLGDTNPARGLSRGGIVRESEFRLRVEGCGDDLNQTDALSRPGLGIPAMEFCQAEDAVTSVDGSNQVSIPLLWTVFNHGTIWFGDLSRTEVMRRLSIGRWELHGHTGGGQTGDLAVIEGRIASLKVDDLVTNSAPPGKASVRVRGSAQADARPRGIDLTVNITNTAGSGVVVEDADSFRISGWTNPATVGGDTVYVAPTSTLYPGKDAVGSKSVIDVLPQSGTDPKVNVPANLLGSVVTVR